MRLKKIRFNLKFSCGMDENGQEKFVGIRSLKDLETHLNLFDLYEYYESKHLERWLEAQGEEEKAQRLADIPKDANTHDQMAQMLEILDLEIDPVELKNLVDAYYFSERIKAKRLETNENLHDQEFKGELKDFDNMSQPSFKAYIESLLLAIEKKDDFPAVKSIVRGIISQFPEILRIDWLRFCAVMVKCCPAAILALLMDEESRALLSSRYPTNIEKYYYSIYDDLLHDDLLHTDKESIDYNKDIEDKQDLLFSIVDQCANDDALLKLSARIIALHNLNRYYSLNKDVLLFDNKLLKRKKAFDLSKSYDANVMTNRDTFNSMKEVKETINSKSFLEILFYIIKVINLYKKFLDILGDEVRKVDYSNSYGSWREIVPKGTKVMILRCEPNADCRSLGDSSGDRWFPIYDGLEARTPHPSYKSSTSVFYVELN